MPAKAVAEQVKFAFIPEASGLHPRFNGTNKVVNAILGVCVIVSLWLAGEPKT